MHDIGAYLKYKSESEIGILIIDREHVLGAWKNVDNTNIAYQLTLFCNKLFEDVSDFYPDFSGWVSRKVVPGIINGDREIIIALDSGKQAGYSVIKNTVKEKKICTLYVEPRARNKHIGTAYIKYIKDKIKRESSTYYS
ncbi:GNAT family N-acetyltransferase [Aeromonas schubertii]|uniref:GNAT family N-acetyltransferase n=1 Tax=Aeromonas schubertii TaxID=652 RepID=UPI00118761FD|nr:GNAT family N-acetyltransferase [Aeromonas schubertii]